MAKLHACPSPDQLKSAVLGELPQEGADGLIEHIEQCSSCAASLNAVVAEDTLVEAVRSQDTLGDRQEQQAVARLVEKLRSLVPEGDSIVERSAATEMPSVTPSVLKSDDTAGFSTDESDEEETEDDGLAPPQAANEIGRLGPYRVLKVLGQGGMGKVFLAEDPHLQRSVALKVMKPSLARNAASRRRFLREARLAASIEHDNIVHIYQVGEDRSVPFLAMQFLKGCSLEDLIKRSGRLKIQQAVRIGIQAAEGLAAAHERGMIHRDIKPGNIWIEPTGGGRVKILDFGLARSSEGETGITQSGAILGTPAYMPPEQARGAKVDHRCDLYSLGCVIYLMTTGDLPLRGNDTMAMLMALATQDPIAPIERNADIPKALSDLVMHLLAKDPERRVGSAKEVVLALKAIERNLQDPVANRTEVLSESMLPSQAVPPKPVGKELPKEGKRAGLPATAPTDVVVGKANTPPAAAKKAKPAAVPKAKSAPSAKRSIPMGLSIAAAGAVALFALLGVVFFLQTPNGTVRIETDDPNLTFKADDKGNYALVGGNEKELSFSVGEHALKFKAGDMEFETDKFVVRKNDKVRITIELLKGKMQIVQDGKAPAISAIPPAVVAVAPPVVEPIVLKPGLWQPGPTDSLLPGLISAPATRADKARWQIISKTPAPGKLLWSPDGSRIAVESEGVDFVRMYDAKTGDLTGVVPRGKTTFQWSTDSKWLQIGMNFWAPDGSRSAVPAVQTYRAQFGWNPKYPIMAYMPADRADRIHLIDPNKATIEIASDQNFANAAWSPDGEWLVVVREGKTAQIFSREGKAGPVLEGAVDPVVAPSWNPQSTMIAAAINADEVRFWNKDGSAGATTGKHEFPLVRLDWRPDGKVLAAFEWNQKRNPSAANLRFWNLDGKAAGSADTGASFAHDNPTASPRIIWCSDGKSYFTQGAMHTHDPRYNAVKFAPSLEAPLVDVANGLRFVSPDGSRVFIQYESKIDAWKDGKQQDIGCSIDSKGSVLFGNAWKPDSREIAIASNDGVVIYDASDGKKRRTLGGGAPVGPYDYGSAYTSALAFSPKGDRVALGTEAGRILVGDADGKSLKSIVEPPSGQLRTSESRIYRLQWHPDGRHLLALQSKNCVVFDGANGKEVGSIAYNPVNAFACSALFSPENANTVLFITPDGCSLWDWKTEKEPTRKTPGLGILALSPDGKRFVSTGTGEGLYGGRGVTVGPAVVSIDLKTRTPIEAKDLPTSVDSLRWSGAPFLWHPDGIHLLVGGPTLTMRTQDGKIVKTYREGKLGAGSLVLSPDRKTMLVDGSLLLDVDDTQQTPVDGRYVQFSPDGKYLVGPQGGAISYWNVASKKAEQIVCLLPDDQCVAFSPAGEVLAASPDALKYFAAVIEGKDGVLTLRSVAELQK